MASLAMASCAMDEDTSTSEQDLGGVTVSVSCDSGTSSVIFASTVSGGTAPYTYAWSSISNTGPLMHLPMHPESVHATCDATRHPPTSAAQVVVTDSLGAQGSGSCSVACNAGPW
ncbi:MAG TPA: hypothetical protein VGM88_23345 [Kofleriaceae bacterium]